MQQNQSLKYKNNFNTNLQTRSCNKPYIAGIS